MLLLLEALTSREIEEMGVLDALLAFLLPRGGCGCGCVLCLYKYRNRSREKGRQRERGERRDREREGGRGRERGGLRGRDRERESREAGGKEGASKSAHASTQNDDIVNI